MRHNCWSCKYDAERDGYHYCLSPDYTGGATDEQYAAVAEWVEENVDDSDDGMPTKNAHGCPAWRRRENRGSGK